MIPQAQGQVGAASSDEQRQQTGFGALSEEEKAHVERLLFLLDKFCVGDTWAWMDYQSLTW